MKRAGSILEKPIWEPKKDKTKRIRNERERLAENLQSFFLYDLYKKNRKRKRRRVKGIFSLKVESKSPGFVPMNIPASLSEKR
jgi:hypothetical protein